MKTNPLTSKLRNFYASISKHRHAVAIIALLLFFLLISLVACKSPATLTNDTQHRTRDSNYHATVHRIETHDTIIIGPSKSPLKGDFGFSPFKGEPEGVLGGSGWVPLTPHFRPHHHPTRHRLHPTHRHPPTHPNHHPKRTLYPALLPLLHHNTCNTYNICNISI